MKLYIFVSNNITNIWAGIGAGRWAVSEAEPSIMKARATRAKQIRVGSYGLIYCSHESSKSLTTPFMFVSKPDPKTDESQIWPERWRMAFSIHPLGNPKLQWNAREAAAELPFNSVVKKSNVASVFKTVGTTVFSPIDIGEEDWEMIIGRLGNLSRGI